MCAPNLAVNDLPMPVTRRSGGALALSLAGSQMQRRCSGPGPARDGLTGSPGLDASHKLPSPPGPALTWVVCVRRQRPPSGPLVYARSADSALSQDFNLFRGIASEPRVRVEKVWPEKDCPPLPPPCLPSPSPEPAGQEASWAERTACRHHGVKSTATHTAPR